MIKKIRKWLQAMREAEQARVAKLHRVAGYEHAAAWILLWASAEVRDDTMIGNLRAEMVDERHTYAYRKGIELAFDDYARLAERDK